MLTAPNTAKESDWYERRRELDPGQVFRTRDGGVVKLERGVPGDGTRWYVATWLKGYSSKEWGTVPDHWSHEDDTIEPGDLSERLPDDWKGEGA